jgi:hypothetical protein
MQMMNVAMQLLQSKGGSGAAAAAATSGELGAAALHGLPGWPQAVPPPGDTTNNSMGDGAVSEQLPAVPHQGESANTEHVSGPLPPPQAAPDGGNAPMDCTTVGRMGFKPQAAQMGAYTAAFGNQGFSFPPLGPMPAGWPPADMTDQALDSKLRPPAA